jgi:hypothetical protein
MIFPRQVDMLRVMKNPKSLFALIICLSVPILSVYFLYCDLADDGPLSSEEQYENADIDDFFSVPNCENQLEFSGSIESNALCPVFLLETNTVEQVSFLCSLTPCFEQKDLVLRC